MNYILKRILLFIPTLIIISLLAFIISVNAPGNPVERMIVAAHEAGEEQNSNTHLDEQKKYWTTKLGLDLPVFYVALSDAASPDTLFKIANSNEKEALQRMLSEYGNWQAISAYYLSLKNLQIATSQLKNDNAVVHDAMNNSKNISLSLLSSFQKKNIQFQLDELEKIFSQYSFLNSLLFSLNEAKQRYSNLETQKTIWKNYIPVLHFFAHNQYHRWIFGDGNWLSGRGSTFSKGIIRGDFGTSYTTKQAVSEKIWKRLKVSLFFSLISILLAYAISIPIGIRAASRKNSLFDKSSGIVLFLLYSLPSFFIATLLLMTFANPDMLNWFPASGIQSAAGIAENTEIFETFKIRLPYFILPLICYSYSSLAFLSRSMRSSILETLPMDYIRTARAKGLSEQAVIYKHAFKNALFPIITLFATVFPFAVGGSIILETIFTIPGIGLETYKAIQNQDYPMIVAIFTLTGVMTLIGYFISDILYAAVDPRISFSKNKRI